MKLNLTLHAFGEKVIYFVSFFVISVLTLFNILIFASVEQKAVEKVLYKNALIYAIVAVMILALFLWINVKWDIRIHETWLFCGFSVLYLLGGIYIIINIDPTLRADAKILHDAASSAALGDFSFLEPGQNLYCHPYQLGMVTYERLLGVFSNSPRCIFLMNVFGVIGINLFTWKLADLIFGQDYKTNLFTIFCSFCFMPQFFFLTFAYGLIPGFFCLVGAFYFQQKYFVRQKKIDVTFCVLLAVLSTIMKGNFLIGVIAIALLFIMRMLKEQRIQYVIAVILIVLCVGISEKVVPAFYEFESGIELSEGTPNITFIAMGTNPGNVHMAPGWHDGYDEWAFNESGLDPQKTSEMAMEQLQRNFLHWTENPDEAVGYFGKKLASIWCDPLFQSIWSGPLQDCGQNVATLILASLYHGGTLWKLLSGLMKIFIVILLILAVAFMIEKDNRKYSFQYALLYLVGGFLVHLIWEGKSQYVYPYIFILIPGCAHELNVLCGRLKSKLAKGRTNVEKVG